MTAEAIFRRRHLAVFRYLKRMSGSRDAAEEMTQDVFVRVVRALPRYRPEGKESAWVFGIARNVLLNRFRTLSRRPEESDVGETELPAPNVLPIHGLALDQALERLPQTERDAFLLRELGGLGYADIAAVCDLTPDAVRSRIYRARAALREHLSGGSRRRVSERRNR